MANNRPKTSAEQILAVPPDELGFQGTRTAFNYDTFGVDSNFFVRVLTIPLPINNFSINSWRAGTAQASTAGNSSQDQLGRERLRTPSYQFMGRIVGSDDRPSPHQMIPDPNNSSLFKCDKAIAQAIMQHTLFVSQNGHQGKIPKVGDICKVKLLPGDFKFNLQNAFFDELTVVNDGTNTYNTYARTNSKSVFNNHQKKAQQLGAPQTATYHGEMNEHGVSQDLEIINGKLPQSILRTVGHRPSADPKDQIYSKPATILVDMMGDYKKLTDAFYNDSAEIYGQPTLFPVKRVYRSYERQVQVKALELSGEGAHAATPGTSIHGWGFAIDMHTTDGDGVSSFRGKVYLWMDKNARKYNFVNPSWAREGKKKAEAWHWEWTKGCEILKSDQIKCEK